MFSLFFFILSSSKAMELDIPYNTTISAEATKVLEEFKIIPDLTIRPPHQIAQVQFHDGTFADLGNIVTEKQLKEVPDIRWEAEKEEEHTIVIMDLDHKIPNYNSSETHYAHWVVGNVAGCFTPGGLEIVSYQAPKINETTGELHRLLFSVYYQYGGSRDFFQPKTVDEISKFRMWFNIHNLTDKYIFVGPIAMNFVRAHIAPVEITKSNKS